MGMRRIPAAIISIPHSLYPIYIYFLEYRPTGDSFLHVNRYLIVCLFSLFSSYGGRTEFRGLSGSLFFFFLLLFLPVIGFVAWERTGFLVVDGQVASDMALL